MVSLRLHWSKQESVAPFSEKIAETSLRLQFEIAGYILG